MKSRETWSLTISFRNERVEFYFNESSIQGTKIYITWEQVRINQRAKVLDKTKNPEKATEF